MLKPKWIMCKCYVCGARDESLYHIVREYSKIAQKKYRTRHDLAEKLINWELCKKLKFDHTTK